MELLKVNNFYFEIETSVMMNISPETVKSLDEVGDGKERLSKIEAIQEGWTWTERRWSQVTADTGIGDPKNASREKSKNFLHDLMSDLFVQLAKAELDDLYE